MKPDDKRRRSIVHGTFRGYSAYRCRCSLCRTNWNEYQCRLRAKNPTRYREYSRRWEQSNQIKCREMTVRWIGNNKQWHVFRRQLWKRGLTLDQFHALSERQDFCCAICHEELTMRPTIDHCHATERIRGLLCMNCNLGLGQFKDNPARLLTAAQYLGQYAR